MGFEVDRVITYMQENKDSLKTKGFELFNEALQNAGLKYHKAENVQKNIEWKSDSSVSDFCRFWSSYLDKISLTAESAVHKGDIVVKKSKVQQRTIERLFFVEEVKSEKPLGLKLRDTETWQNSAFDVDSKDSNYAYTLLQLSRLGPNWFSYHCSIFKKILGINQEKIGLLISLCIPGIKNKNKNSRNNTLGCLFDYIDGNTLQETIATGTAVLKNKENSNSESDANDFAKKKLVDFISKTRSDYGNLVVEILDLVQKCEVKKFENREKEKIERNFGLLKSYKTASSDFVRGKASNQMYAFFNDEDNRRLFQYRFSCVFQLYLLLYHKELYELPDEPESYDALTSDRITEYITLKKCLLNEISGVINFLSEKNEQIYVHSIFHLAGLIFDSIDFTPNKSRVPKDEFRQYTENVLCYGEGRLDFFQALNRYKNSNRFAAEKLSEIYYFGREFDGYMVERDIQKSIELLNSWKDHSVSARWSLAENYMRVSEEKKTSPENREKNFNHARELYNQCGDYPPALNSKARLLIEEVLNQDNCLSEEGAKQKVKEAIQCVSKSALSGWVYAFNNLYAWLTKAAITKYLDKSDIDEAYSTLIPVSGSINKENEICDITRKLKEGIQRKIETYVGESVDYTFKYFTPVNNPINFLVVSAYLGNLYGINYLGLAIVNKEQEKAKILFEHAAKYGKWGYRNLAKHFYSENKMINKLLNDKADEIEKRIEQWRYYTYPLD